MGKDKERRPKAQKGPTSSAQAQQFLQNQSASGGGLANAFARFKNKGLGTAEASSGASFEDISDPILRQNFKHLSKKDPTTRLKALQAISAAINEMKDPAELKTILPEWISSLKKMSIDNSRRVRELAYTVFKQVIQIVKKELGPYLKSIIGIWFIVMHESDREVANAAREAFYVAFPEEKRKNVLLVCQDEILELIEEHVLRQNLQTLSSTDMTEIEAKERYNRVISATIEALSRIIAERFAKGQEEQQTATTSAPATSATMHETAEKLATSVAFWKMLSVKEYADVRAAAYKLVTTLTNTYKEVLLTETKGGELQLNPNVALPVLGCFSETSIVVHKNMMEALLSVMKAYPPKQVWASVQPLKSVFPRLFAFLRNVTTSSPSVTFPSLLPFISFLNFDVLGGSNSKTLNFFDSFFANLWAGYRSIGAQADSAIITAYVECLMYTILQSGKYLNEQEAGAAAKFHDTLMKNFFMEKAVKFYLMKRFVKRAEVYGSLISKAIDKFSTKPALSGLLQEFWSQFYAIVVDCLATTPNPEAIQEEKIDLVDSSAPEEDEEEQDESAAEQKKKQQEKQQEKKIAEEKYQCEDPFATVERLRVFLTELQSASAETKINARQFATRLFEFAAKTAIETDSAVHLNCAVMLVNVFPITDFIGEGKNMDEAAFFSKLIIPGLEKHLVTKDAPLSDLVTLSAALITLVPQQFVQQYDSVVSRFVNHPVVMMDFFNKLYAEASRQSKGLVLDASVLGKTTIAVLKAAFSTSSRQAFVDYTNLLVHLVANVKGSLTTLSENLPIIKEFISKPQSYRTYTTLLKLLQTLVVTLFNSSNVAELSALSELKTFAITELMTFIFNMRLMKADDNVYLSDTIMSAVGVSAAKTDPEKDELAAQAYESWKEVETCIPQFTEQQKASFIDASLAQLQTVLFDPKTSATISHSVLFDQAQTLTSIGVKTTDIWKALVFDRNKWKSLEKSLLPFFRPVVIGNRTFVVPSSETITLETVEAVRTYARYLSFVSEVIKMLNVSTVFLDNDLEGKKLENIWLISELLHALHYSDIFSKEASQQLNDFVKDDLLQQAVYLTRSEHTLTPSVQSQYFTERILAVTDFLFAEGDHHPQSPSSLTIKKFLRLTSQELHNAAEQGITVATKLLRDLYTIITKQYLLEKTLSEVLNSTDLTHQFATISEALFTSDYDQEDQRLNRFVSQKLLVYEEFTPIIESITIWVGQCASLLLQVATDIAQKKYVVERSDRLLNTLSVLSGLVIIFTNLEGEKQGEIRMFSIVDILKEFTERLLESNYANDYSDFVDMTVSKLISFINKRYSVEAVKPEHLSFIVNFIEQSIVRSTSYLSSTSYSAADLQQLFQTLFSMIDLSRTLAGVVQKERIAEVEEKLYLHVVSTFTALNEFNNTKQPQFQTLVKTFRNIVLFMMDSTAQVIDFIPGSAYTKIDNSSQQLFSKLACSIINSNSISVICQVAGAQLLRSHQQFTVFVKKSVQHKETASNVEGSEQQDKKVMEAIKTTVRYDLFAPLQKIMQNVPIQLRESHHTPLKLKPIQQFAANQKVTASQQMLSYLLGWMSFVDLFQRHTQMHPNDEELKRGVITLLKEKKWYNSLLDIVIAYVLAAPASDDSTPIVTVPLSSEDFLSDNPKVAYIRKGIQSSVTHASLAMLSAQLLFKMFKNFPSLVRVWYKHINDKLISETILKYVTDNLSPLLIKEEVVNIAANSKSLPSHVRIKPTTANVTAIYEQDEVKLDIKLTIGASYPLQPLEISSTKRLGVSEQQWRKWMLKMTTLLFTQAGNLWDAILMWKDNLDKHFSGVEPCPICYSVVHTNDQSLPKIACHVCSNKYHSACLYKWINTSGNTSCPTCRSTNSFGLGT